MAIDWTKPIETVEGEPAERRQEQDEGEYYAVFVRTINKDRDLDVWFYDKDGTSNHWLPVLRNVVEPS